MNTATRAGTVDAAGTRSQHVDLYRKVLLRRGLLAHAVPGPAYLPFVGDGDLAVELYLDRPIFAADLDPERVATAGPRLPGAQVRVADCDAWPFADVDQPFAVADLDAWVNPYQALVAFWAGARKADRVVIFGTDGHRQTIKRQHKTIVFPSGEALPTDPATSRSWFNFYWCRHVLPWLTEAVAPWRVVETAHYLRGGAAMLYWGIVVEPPPATIPTRRGAVAARRAHNPKVEGASPSAATTSAPKRATSAPSSAAPPQDTPAVAAAKTREDEVEDALFEAAKSGNVTAAETWLKHRRPERWSDVPTSATPDVDRTIRALAGRRVTTTFGEAAKVIWTTETEALVEHADGRSGRFHPIKLWLTKSRTLADEIAHPRKERTR